MGTRPAFTAPLALNPATRGAHRALCMPRRRRARSALPQHSHLLASPRDSSSAAHIEGKSERPDETKGETKLAVPWKNPSVPVYTASCYSTELARGNFNIVTYAMPCSIGVHPRWAVALYVGTLTWATVQKTGKLRLGVLAARHAALVDVFGRAGGRELDKPAEAQALGFRVGVTVDRVPYLMDSAGYIDLAVEQWVPCGDHDLAVCDMTGSESLAPDDAGDELSTGTLRALGLL